MDTKAKWIIGVLCKKIDTAVCVSGHFLAVGIVIAQIASVTTVLYRTEHKLYWAIYIDCVCYICIACALLAILFAVLSKFIVFPKDYLKKIQRRDKIYKTEIAIVWVLYFLSLAVSMVMWGGTGQTFTGDPWWYHAGRSLMFPAAAFLFTRQMQRLAFERIKKCLTPM